MSRSERATEMELLAEKLGFSYLAGGDNKFRHEAFHESELLRRGDVRGIRNVLRGQRKDLEFYVIDYYYRGAGNYSKPFDATVSAVRCPKPLPEFSLEPETFAHKIASYLGSQDIDFASYPDFSKRYLLRSPDPSAVTMLFDGRIASSLGNDPGWTLVCIGDWLLACRIGKFVPSGQIETWLERVSTVSDLFLST